MVGRILDRLLETFGVILFRLGLAPLVRRIGGKTPKVLLYHECADEETPYLKGLECTTPLSHFQQHLDYLSKHHKVVPLDDILSGEAGDGAVAITFDDGYASVYDKAYPMLAAKDFPAVVYLIADAVDNQALVWVNELNHALWTRRDDILPCLSKRFAIDKDQSNEEILSHCRLNYDREKIEGALAEYREIAGQSGADHARAASLYLSWEQIADMEAKGITFGNHTATHPNMERLSEAEQEEEILRAQEILSPRLKKLHSFAHPFGHRGNVAADVALSNGALAALEVGGSNAPLRPKRVGRVHLSNENVPQLFARMELVEPIKEWIRRRAARA